MGPANSLGDAELIALLQRPPKSVTQLRTKSAFSSYFQGMKMARFLAIAQQAFSDSEEKVEKRLALVRDVLV